MKKKGKKRKKKRTIENVKKGLTDIVIGTHRVLSNDVEFKDLGLLIIDEEQRFGVTHKEKIKQMKKNIDVLTLTATPIPRTLHMSLIGIRDMSVLEEAPMDRMPVQTYVMEYNEEIVREAIERELSRAGRESSGKHWGWTKKKKKGMKRNENSLRDYRDNIKH